MGLVIVYGVCEWSVVTRDVLFTDFLSRAPCPLDSIALGYLNFFYSLCYVCYIRTRKCVNIKHGQKMSDCIAIFDKHSGNWKFR